MDMIKKIDYLDKIVFGRSVTRRESDGRELLFIITFFTTYGA
jgi:hypothetical protein